MARYEESTQDSYDEARTSREVAVKSRERRPGEIVDGRRDRLWRMAEVLDNAVDTLTSRLVPVLLPERAGAALGAVEGDSPDASELGLYLDHLTVKLESLGRRVSELSERVDL